MNIHEFLPLIGNSWENIITIVIAIGTVIGYFITRKNELAWKRTEFLCEQSQYLEDDPVMVEIITILEGRHPNVAICDIFASQKLSEQAKLEYLQKFDKFLNFLWRLSYSYLEVKTISRKEISGFGSYFWLISKSQPLLDYCEENGFEDIIKVIDILKRAEKW